MTDEVAPEPLEVHVDLVEAPTSEPPVVAPPAEVSSAEDRRGLDPWRLVKVGLLSLVGAGLLLLVWLVLLSSLVHARSQRALEQRFVSELVDGVAPVNLPVAPGTPIAVLRVPAIGLDEVVVAGSRSRQLMSGPGHLRTSAFPGQPGASVLFGRSAAYGGPFARLGDLSPGDPIEVTTGQGTVIYRVSTVTRHSGTDASAFVAPRDSLLLVTASPRLVASGRLVVTAEPDGPLHEPGAAVVQPPATNDELGLGGSSLAVVGLLVWLEVLVLVLVAGVVLAFRWRRWPTWVIVAPVVGVAGWLTFEYLSLLLPATL
jgi:LPXTG-site transpeptidase (sortase) family protein